MINCCTRIIWLYLIISIKKCHCSLLCINAHYFLSLKSHNAKFYTWCLYLFTHVPVHTYCTYVHTRMYILHTYIHTYMYTWYTCTLDRKVLVCVGTIRLLLKITSIFRWSGRVTTPWRIRLFDSILNTMYLLGGDGSSVLTQA